MDFTAEIATTVTGTVDLATALIPCGEYFIDKYYVCLRGDQIVHKYRNDRK